MNREIQARRDRMAREPRVGDVLIVQQPAGKFWPGKRRADIWERFEVIGVGPSEGWHRRLSRRGVIVVRVRITFPRAPRQSPWRHFGGTESVRFAGAPWMSWPSEVRRAQATREA